MNCLRANFLLRLSCQKKVASIASEYRPNNSSETLSQMGYECLDPTLSSSHQYPHTLFQAYISEAIFLGIRRLHGMTKTAKQASNSRRCSSLDANVHTRVRMRLSYIIPESSPGAPSIRPLSCSFFLLPRSESVWCAALPSLLQCTLVLFLLAVFSHLQRSPASKTYATNLKCCTPHPFYHSSIQVGFLIRYRHTSVPYW